MIGAQRAGAATVAGLLAATLCVAAAPPAQAAASAGWRLVATRHFGAPRDLNGLSAVVAPGSNDAWAFGGTGLYGGGVPVAEHWNGRSWGGSRSRGR